MTDNLLDFELPENKNSLSFDEMLLNEMVNLQNVPIKKFMPEIRRIMRKKSSCKLWFTNNQSREWDGKQYRVCNFRCIPTSRKAGCYFCLLLNRTETQISVIDGFLTAV